MHVPCTCHAHAHACRLEQLLRVFHKLDAKQDGKVCACMVPLCMLCRLPLLTPNLDPPQPHPPSPSIHLNPPLPHPHPPSQIDEPELSAYMRYLGYRPKKNEVDDMIWEVLSAPALISASFSASASAATLPSISQAHTSTPPTPQPPTPSAPSPSPSDQIHPHSTRLTLTL